MYVIGEGCPGCGNCKDVCPAGAIEQVGIGMKINVQCVDCGICSGVCPVRLIRPVPTPEVAVQAETTRESETGRSDE